MDVPVAVDAPGGLQPVGELFDHRRRSADDPVLPLKKRHPLVVDADAFARTVQGDAGRIFVGERTGAVAGGAPLLVVRIEDVRTSVPRPRFTDLRGRMTSRIVLRADLRDGSGVIWSRLLEGEGEKLVYYVRLVHHETTLSAAYCAALARLRDAVPEIAGAVAATRPSGLAPGRRGGEALAGAARARRPGERPALLARRELQPPPR